MVVFASALAATAGPPPATQPLRLDVEAPDFPPTTDIELKPAAEHPRLVFRPAGREGFGRSFDHVRKLYRTDATFKAIFDRSFDRPDQPRLAGALAAQWIITGQDKYAAQAVDWLLKTKITESAEGGYSNVWIFALAYDWLYHSPAMTPQAKSAIEGKIVKQLAWELNSLDKRYMAMWHGRTQAANGAMIAALAVADLPGQDKQLRRAAAHYLVALRALQFSGGWPEGASYWIYNRAGPYALAADCVMSALGVDKLAGVDIRAVMKTVGLWQVYQFGPNEVFEPYGDSQGNLSLGETGWWELTTDHFAKVSADPGLAAGADYIRNHSKTPYGKWPFYWMSVMTYEPAVRPKGDYNPAQPEVYMRKHLPRAMLFGRDALGVAYFRSEWGSKDETYASFKAGDLLAHHDHYDAGTFTIYKGSALAPQTGRYSDYFGEHRLGYMIQTVSKNGILVLAPGEFSHYLKRNGKFTYNALAGGQRVMRPTGFDCTSVEHFRRMLDDGPRLRRARILDWVSDPGGDYDYVAADITPAYNSTLWAEPGNPAKVSLVVRRFLFLRPEQAFVIFDRVETTDPKFLSKFVLHSQVKAASDDEKLLAGNGPDDGILATGGRELVTQFNRGKLTHRVLLPEQARTLKIGGPNFRWYVEEDGDQSDGFDGRNLVKGCRLGTAGGQGAEVRSGWWRTETEPTSPSQSVRFLNVLLPRLADDNSPLPHVRLIDVPAGAVAVRVGTRTVTFSEQADERGSVRVERAK